MRSTVNQLPINHPRMEGKLANARIIHPSIPLNRSETVLKEVSGNLLSLTQRSNAAFEGVTDGLNRMTNGLDRMDVIISKISSNAQSTLTILQRLREEGKQ